MLTENQEKEVSEFCHKFVSFAGCHRHGDVLESAIEKLSKEHPTNQQSLMRFMIRLIRELSLNRSDDRNKRTVLIAKQIVEEIGEPFFEYV